MAHADNSIITGKFKGSLGKQLVFRQWQGKTIVAKSPKARVGDPTAAQAETQERFLAGSRYALSVTKGADQTLAQAGSRLLLPMFRQMKEHWRSLFDSQGKLQGDKAASFLFHV